MKHIKLFEQFLEEGVWSQSALSAMNRKSRDEKYFLTDENGNVLSTAGKLKTNSSIQKEFKLAKMWGGFMGGQVPKFINVHDLKKNGEVVDQYEWTKTGAYLRNIDPQYIKYKDLDNLTESTGFEQFINEADITQPIEGKEVVVMPGRFQPFHNGHIAALKNAAKMFGKPVIAMQILSKKDESPFPEDLLLQIGQDVAKNEKEIEDFFIYPNSYGKTVIPWFVRFLREQGYETVGVGAGSDRIKGYTPQIKYMTSDRTDTVVHPDFELKMVDARAEGGPSGTKTRAALKADDREAFEKMVPAYLYKYYDKLKKYV